MNVKLKPAVEAMVREQVNSGRFHNENDVVAAALHLMHEHDESEAQERAALLELIDEGLRDLDEGRFTTFETDEDLKAFFNAL